MSDRRRRIPRTDQLLDQLDPLVRRHGTAVVTAAIRTAQQQARAGEIEPEQVAARVHELLRQRRMRPVLNATGIVVHTNLGRSPLPAEAVEAMIEASGYADVELDLATGKRSSRGTGAHQALLAACPAAEDALVVNNGAAALVLATTALAADQEVVISRGELIEIGAGFRLPELITSTGARLHEVGATNRTHEADYRGALGEQTGCLLKVHPSNFAMSGFVAQVGIPELSRLAVEHRVPLVVDLGSGLLHHDPMLPDEPDATTALQAGADLVIASGDKLLGGPQAGLLLGRADLVERLRRHPLARALRVDKLTLAALQATLASDRVPVTDFLRCTADELESRTRRLAESLCAQQIRCEVVPHTGHVGGGGAPGVPLPGWAIALDEELAAALRLGEPAVLARTEKDRCLVDLRCIRPEQEERLTRAIIDCAQSIPRKENPQS